MGWGYCGVDSKGRGIGYAFEAICDHIGCNKEIDRGLAYACGDMHGEADYYCEKYFCDIHLFWVDDDNIPYRICENCKKWIESENDMS